jgi:hypothetical protein
MHKNLREKYTEGPWNRGDVVEIPWGSEKAQVMCIESGDTIVGLSVVRGPFIDDVCDESEAEANARLIACAPQLYDLLQRINTAFYTRTSRKEWIDLMNETKPLLMKARGENG